MADFSHLTSSGNSKMVDVSPKGQSQRLATASGQVHVSEVCRDQLDLTSVEEISRCARIAGIMATKKTSDLIPMCHPIAVDKVDLSINFSEETCIFSISVTTGAHGKTGVEMESLCAAQIAAATIYDMIKAVDPAARLGPFQVEKKSGGKAGAWKRQ